MKTEMKQNKINYTNQNQLRCFFGSMKSKAEKDNIPFENYKRRLPAGWG